MTNNDKINAMSVEEKAEFLKENKCERCSGYRYSEKYKCEVCHYIDCSRLMRCYAGIKEWLEREAEE